MCFLIFFSFFVKHKIRKFMNNNSNYVFALEISFQLKSLCILLVHTVTETKRRTEKQEAVRDGKPSKAAHSLGTNVCLGE